MEQMLEDTDGEFASVSRYAPHMKCAPGVLGSGKDGTFITAAPCANITCASDATLAHECPKCRLVSYCTSACKSAHAKLHRRVCGVRHPRQAHHLRTVHRKAEAEIQLNRNNFHFPYLWGNVPAISLVNPARTPLPADLNLCFAASGDLRDFFSTLSKIPESFTGRVQILINDIDPEVCARNFVMLELLRLYGREAIECVIALWYSLGMTDAQSLACKAATFNAMESSSVLRKFALDGSRAELLVEPVEFALGRSTLTVDLSDQCWATLIAYLSASLTTSAVAELRSSAAIWKKEREVNLFHWESGLLLPFSCIGQMQFSAGNCFLPRPIIELDKKPSYFWYMSAHADPLSGWDPNELMITGAESGCPARDYYGALFFHCKKVLTSAIETLERCKVEIKLSSLDARRLAERVKRESGVIKFDGVGTSNISDNFFLGMERVLSDWGPLLKRKNGTLVTLSMMWYARGPIDPAEAGKYAAEWALAALEWKGPRTRRGVQSPVAVVCNSSTDAGFERRMREIGAYGVAERIGLEARERHRLVSRRICVPLDAARHALPVQFYTEEVLERAGASWSFMERYVEWQLI